MAVSSSQRFSAKGRSYIKQYGCPVCGKFDYCNYSDDMSEVICMRSTGMAAPYGWIAREEIEGESGEGRRYQTETSFADWKRSLTGDYRVTKKVAPVVVEKVAKEESHDIDLYDRVYRRMFALLKLEDRHYAHFKNVRKLSDSQIVKLGVKSAPSRWSDVTDVLVAEFGEKTVLTVPGFYKKDGRIRMAYGESRGFYLPMLRRGKIWSVRFRFDEPGGGAKYVAFSRIKGEGNGTINNGTIYYPDEPFADSNYIGITEGEIKAVTLTDVYRIPFITTVGNAAWRSSGVLDMVRENAVKYDSKGDLLPLTVVVAYDMDANPRVMRDTVARRTSLCQALVEAGYRVKYSEWDSRFGKGLDDVINNGFEEEVKDIWFVNKSCNFPIDRIFDETNMVKDDRGVYRVPNFQAKKRYQIMKWQKGRGKSEWIARKLCMGPNGVPSADRSGLVEEDLNLIRNPGARVLSLTHRVLLGAANAKRWGLSFYRSDKNGEVLNPAEIQGCKRLSITVDSIRSLGYQNELPTFDWIIIDEASQVFRHLTGETLRGKRSDTLNMLITLLRTAKRVTLLDADISREDYDTLVDFVGGKENIEVIVDSGQMPARTEIVRYEGPDGREGIEAEMLASLNADRKIYVTCDSKEYTKETYRLLSETFPEKKFLMINSDNSPKDEIITFLRNINTAQFEYDGLVCSPSVGTGVDIYVPHFQDVYVLCRSNSGITASDVAQQMARVRYPEHIYALICADSGNIPEDSEFWTQWVEGNLHDLEVRLQWDEETRERVMSREEVLLRRLWVRCKMRDARSHNRMSTNFYEQVEAEGHRVVDTIATREELERSHKANLRLLEQYENQATAEAQAKATAKREQVKELETKLNTYDETIKTRKAVSLRARGERKQASGKRKGIKSVLKQERYAGIKGAAELTAEQVKELKTQGAVSDTERYALTRARIERVYGVKVTDEEFQAKYGVDIIEFDQHGRTDKKVKNFALISGKTDVARFMEEEIIRFRKHEKASYEIVPLNFIQEALLLVFSKVGLFDGQTWNTEIRLTAAKLIEDGTAKWLAENRNELSRKLGLVIGADVENNPMKEIGRIADHCGLKLTAHRVDTEPRFYLLDAQRIEMLTEMLDRKEQNSIR